MRVVLVCHVRVELPNLRRQGNPRCLEHGCTCTLSIIPQQESLSILLYLGCVQLLQVMDHVGPFDILTVVFQASL